VTPEAFGQVPVWCIRGVPDDRQPIPMGVHVLPYGLRVVDGAVVQGACIIYQTVDFVAGADPFRRVNKG